MQKINVNLFPKGGYIFKDRDGTTHVSVRSWRDVINRVDSYRRLNNLPIGDPEKEVLEQACQRNPGHCYEDTAAPVKSSTARSTIKSAVLAWLAGIRRAKDTLTYVSPETAAKRTETCANCPFNITLKQGCAPCQTFIAEMRKSILRNRNADSRLNACEKFSRDTGVMVHLDSISEKRDDLPDHCWLKIK
jgi:hypothetical protein